MTGVRRAGSSRAQQVKVNRKLNRSRKTEAERVKNYLDQERELEEQKEVFDAEMEIRAIKERNRRVEMEKAWETSWERRVVITVLTYILAGFWLVIIKDSVPWLKALVPAGGYFLSTASLFFLKKWWVGRKIRPLFSRSTLQGFGDYGDIESSRDSQPPPLI